MLNEQQNKIEEIVKTSNLKSDDWTYLCKGEVLRFGKLLFFQKNNAVRKRIYTRDPEDSQMEFKQGITFEIMQFEKEGWIHTNTKVIAICRIPKNFEDITKQRTGEVEVQFDRVSKYPQIGDVIEIESRVHKTAGEIKILLFNMRETE